MLVKKLKIKIEKMISKDFKHKKKRKRRRLIPKSNISKKRKTLKITWINKRKCIKINSPINSHLLVVDSRDLLILGRLMNPKNSQWRSLVKSRLVKRNLKTSLKKKSLKKLKKAKRIPKLHFLDGENLLLKGDLNQFLDNMWIKISKMNIF